MSSFRESLTWTYGWDDKDGADLWPTDHRDSNIITGDCLIRTMDLERVLDDLERDITDDDDSDIEEWCFKRSAIFELRRRLGIHP